MKIMLRWNKIHQITSESLIGCDDMPEGDWAQMQVKEPVRWRIERLNFWHHAKLNIVSWPAVGIKEGTVEGFGFSTEVTVTSLSKMPLQV